jgi:hypothetical protein
MQAWSAQERRQKSKPNSLDAQMNAASKSPGDACCRHAAPGSQVLQLNFFSPIDNF